MVAAAGVGAAKPDITSAHLTGSTLAHGLFTVKDKFMRDESFWVKLSWKNIHRWSYFGESSN